MKRKSYSLPDIPFPTGAGKHLYEMILEDWEDTVCKYETDPKDFYRSFTYLNEHPIFWNLGVFDQGIKTFRIFVDNELGCDDFIISVYKVNSRTGKYHPNGNLLQVGIETGHQSWVIDPSTNKMERYLDPDLVTDDRTFEQAIVRLAKKVHKKYGNDRTMIPGAKGRDADWETLLKKEEPT